jgi:hypothetical protein
MSAAIHAAGAVVVWLTLSPVAFREAELATIPAPDSTTRGFQRKTRRCGRRIVRKSASRTHERSPPGAAQSISLDIHFRERAYDWRAACAQSKTTKRPFVRRGRQAVRLITVPLTVLGAPQQLFTQL